MKKVLSIVILLAILVIGLMAAFSYQVPELLHLVASGEHVADCIKHGVKLVIMRVRIVRREALAFCQKIAGE